MQAVASIHVLVSVKHATKRAIRGLTIVRIITDATACRLNVSQVALNVLKSSLLSLNIGVQRPIARHGGPATPIAATADALPRQVRRTLVLLYHHVDGFLGIVQVELVVLGLLLLLGLLLVVEVTVHHLLSLLTLLHRDRWATSVGCLGLGAFLLVGAAEDLLLELQLLAHLPRPIALLLLELATARLEECRRLRLGVLGRVGLRGEVVQEHEGWVQLGLLVEPLVQEAHLLVILFLKLALDALILHKLQFFLFLGGCLLQFGLRQSRLVVHGGRLLH